MDLKMNAEYSFLRIWKTNGPHRWGENWHKKGKIGTLKNSTEFDNLQTRDRLRRGVNRARCAMARLWRKNGMPGLLKHRSQELNNSESLTIFG